MRNFLILAVMVGLMSACSSGSKKVENQTTTTDSAQKVETKAATETKTKAEAKSKTAAKTESNSSEGDVSCKSGGDVRKLSVVDRDQGCAVEYTKFGETNEIGSAQNDKSFCGTIVGRVRGNLENAGFTCE